MFSEFIFHISDFTSACYFFQGKRGIEKQPFQLPDFIAATGIEKIRQVNQWLLLVLAWGIWQQRSYEFVNFLITIIRVSLLFQAYIEKEDSKKLKQKQRERMQPKMGKMDIDYQVSLVKSYPNEGIQKFSQKAIYILSFPNSILAQLPSPAYL